MTHCRQLGHYAVLVLGEPTFYQGFGFTKASLHGILCPFDAPDEAFMAAELFPGALAGYSGSVQISPRIRIGEWMKSLDVDGLDADANWKFDIQAADP